MRTLVRIVLTFEGVPVTTNKVWRTYRGAGHVSPEVRKYRQRIAAEMFGGDPCPWEWVGVRIDLWPPDKRKFDTDNRTKSLFDALTHCGFWRDDECVTEFSVVRHEPKKGGLTRMEIYDAGEKYRSDGRGPASAGSESR